MEHFKKEFKKQVSGQDQGRNRNYSHRSIGSGRTFRNSDRPRFIVKANGQTENFSKEKLKRSLIRSGLSKKLSDRIADQVSSEIREGEKTSEIYRRAFNLVKQNSPVATIHYSLKKSLLELGPEGHYFEDYVSKFFITQGFETEVCKTLQGKFVRHEVDCIARKNKDKYFAECKFHNRAGTKNDIKIALYVKARWDDLKEGPEGKDLKGFYVFSNTAFTSDSLTYAQGTGLRLMGVNAPNEKSFLDLIKESKLFPLTSLRNLSRSQKQLLMEKKYILADELTEELMFKLGFEAIKIKRIMDEIEAMKGMKS